MQFRRSTILNLGATLILSLSYYTRINFYLHSKICEGTVTNNVTYFTGRNHYSYAEVKFNLDSTEYAFKGEANLRYPQFTKVPVIYNPQNPADAKIFTFWGFWFTPLLYALGPLLILIAGVTSFWKSTDQITIGRNR